MIIYQPIKGDIMYTFFLLNKINFIYLVKLLSIQLIWWCCISQFTAIQLKWKEHVDFPICFHDLPLSLYCLSSYVNFLLKKYKINKSPIITMNENKVNKVIPRWYWRRIRKDLLLYQFIPLCFVPVMPSLLIYFPLDQLHLISPLIYNSEASGRETQQSHHSTFPCN